MGGQAQEDIDQNLLTPEALMDFIEELRHAGFNIGMAEYIAAQDLLLMLTARGEKLDTPQRISSLFGPLLCSSPAEQESFPEFFFRWNQRYLASRGERKIQHEETMAETLEKTARRSLRWEWILFGIGVVILALTVWFVARNFIQQPGQSPGGPGPLPGPSGDIRPIVQLASVAIGVLGLVYFAWWVWWRRIASQFLQRRQSQGNPDIKRISLVASDETLFPSLTFLSLARMFRQRVQVVSRDLNVVGTVEKSVERGGWLDPIYDRLMIPPEYLVLVDRRSRFDHLAQFVEGMVRQLELHGVFVTVYTFDGDPRLCFPLRGPGRPQPLSELAASLENMRLIVFTEAENLLNPVSGRLAPWSRLLHRWFHRAVMTPEPATHWGASERELKREFIVLPGTVDGLAEFMRILHGRQNAVAINEWAASSLPSLMQERPQRWIERDAPSPSQIDSLLNDLKVYLGEDGYAWLKACAVYPELQWQITITLGQLLHDSQGKPLLDPKRIVDLARLPWFRYGLMPDWLRTRLILELEPNQEQEVRSALEALLVTAVQGHGESLDLEVAYERRDWTSRLARPLLKLLSRESPPGSPINDHVFLDFMLQRLNLAVRVPDRLRRQLLADVGDQPGWKVLLQWIGVNSAAIVPYLLISVLSAALGFTHLHTPTGTEVPVALLASLLIGPLFGLAQWLVLRRFWKLRALSWIGWTTFALNIIPLLVSLYFASVGSGPQLYGSELGLTSLAILGVLQARLLARHHIVSSNLWWIGGIGTGLLNTLVSFAFVQETVSGVDLQLALFIFGTVIIYGLISGWILLHSLQSRKIGLAELIRPIWILTNMLGFAIGAFLAFILIVGVDAFGGDSTGDVFIGTALMMTYLPISLSQWYVFRSCRFPYSGLWFWVSFLIPVLIFFLIIFPLANRETIDIRILVILTGLLVGLVAGFFQGLLWRRSGLQPFFALVWFLCNTIGWSCAFIGISVLDVVTNSFTPVTWDQAVAFVMSITILPYAFVTALPLAPLLQEVLRRQPSVHELTSYDLNKIRVSPTAWVAQIMGRDSSDRAPL